MFWLAVLSTVLLGVGVIVFILTRDSFRAPHTRHETPLVASPEEKINDATAINAIMQESLPELPPSSHLATLFSGQSGKETDVLADTLAQVKNSTHLPSAPKAYLRFEEHDDSLDRLLLQRAGGPGARQMPAREFSIGVTEKKEPPLEHEK